MMDDIVRNRRPLLAFVAVVLLLTIGADMFWLVRQKAFLRERQLYELQDDLDLLSESAVNDILKKDYINVEKTIIAWASRHDEVVSVVAEAQNGFVLARYENPNVAKTGDFIRLKQPVRYGSQDLLTLSVTEHTLNIDEQWSRFLWQNIALSFLAAMALTAILWFVLRRTAFDPADRLLQEVRDLNDGLEQRVMERTAEIEGMNEALEEEVAVRRQAEDNLRVAVTRAEEERSKTEAFLAAISDGVSIVDLDYRLIYQNESHIAMMGPHSGRVCYEAYHGRAKACDGCPVTQTIQDTRVHLVERQMKDREGRERTIEVTTSPLMDDTGQVSAVIELMRDITERRRAQEVIRSVAEGTDYETGTEFFVSLVRHLASALRFRYAFVGALVRPKETSVRTLAVWAGDRVGENFEYDLSGTPCRDVLTTKNACIFPSGVQSLFPEDHYLVLMEAQSYLGLPLVAPDGEVLGLLAVLDDKPVPDGEGPMSILRIFASRATAELSRLRAESEKDRMQEQLIQSQKMESIGMLAGGVAHDFNNLLSTILGYGELAMSRLKPGDPAQGPLGYILEAGKRAADLTNQLLAFSRRQVLEMKPVNLRGVIERMAKMLRRMIGEDVALRLELSPEVQPILADAGQMEQVLMNLAVNARDAMPEGGALRMGLRNVELSPAEAGDLDGIEPGAYVELWASDTGMGMLPEVRERIFEPFFTTKAMGKGTGLGLSTVYGIVKQHKGHIVVVSEPGAGTTFRIFFPPTGLSSEIEKRKAEESTSGGQEVVLVVDDEPGIRTLIVDSLKPLGYSVYTASSGEAALDMLRNLREGVDVLLTDIVMPGMKGTDLAEAARRLCPRMKLVYMSGYVDDTRLGGVSGDRIPFIQKPLTPKTLSRRIREVLDA